MSIGTGAVAVTRTLWAALVAVLVGTTLGSCTSSSPGRRSRSVESRVEMVLEPQVSQYAVPDAIPEQAVNGDTIVTLSFSGYLDTLRQMAVAPDGTVTELAQVSLPQHDRTYAGPVATSGDTCLVMSETQTDQGVQTYSTFQYRLSSHTVEEIGAASRPFSYFVGDFGFGLTSYSRFTGTALASPRAPEGMTSAPYIWVPGSARWQTLAQAYPVLSSAGRITAACYSPDGSLLAAGADGRLLVYDLETGRVANVPGPKHSVWTLCVSQDNSELCWTDTDYPSRLGDMYSESPEPGRPIEAGFGIVSLRTGKVEYHPLSEQQGLPSELPGWCGWAEQDFSGCAFSEDSRWLYFQTAHALLRFDRQVSRWDTIARGYLAGFAVMPSRSGEGG